MWVRTLFAILAGLGAVYYIASTLALRRHFLSTRRRRSEGSRAPRVSILKPVCGLDADASENLASYLRLDYPDYEVLFGVLDPDDPSVPIIADLIVGVSNASMHIGSRIEGANNKVRILDNLAGHADGEIIVVTDADTRVDERFLRRITAPFEDDSVGVVTCLYRGVGDRGAPASIEGLHMTCCFAPGAATSACLAGIDFSLGAASAVRRSALDAIGGFASMADYLADDFQLGRRASQAGYRVVLSDYVIDISLPREGWSRVLTRELRWARTIRASRPWGYLGMLFTFGFGYAVVYLLLSGLSVPGWLLLTGVGLVRASTAYLGADRYLGDRQLIRRFHLLPLRDVLSLAVWIGGYLSRTVSWRGRRLRLLPDGTMEPVK